MTYIAALWGPYWDDDANVDFPSVTGRLAEVKLDAPYNACYTSNMKAAISIPDDVFRLADAEAARMGVSRSEFYLRALRAYLDSIEESSITERLDAIYADADQSPDLFLQRAAFLTLKRPGST